MVRKRIILLLLSIIFVKAFAGYGYYGDAFILASKPSKSIAMGGIGLTSINGITAIISNPAGLAGFNGVEIYGQYNNLFGLASQNNVGFSMPFGKYQVGALINTVGVRLNYREDIISDIPNINDRRTYLQEHLNDSTFSDFESALMFSIARETPIDIKLGWSYDRFKIYFQYGLNVKIIYKSMAGSHAIGGGVDGGIRFLIPGDEILYIKDLGMISIGLNIENIIQSPILWFDKYNDQGNMRIMFGTALNQSIELLKSELTFAIDSHIYESVFFPNYGLRFGFQWSINNIVDLRVGKDYRGLGGVGLNLPLKQGKVKIDYSIQNHEISLNHLVSISYYKAQK